MATRPFTFDTILKKGKKKESDVDFALTVSLVCERQKAASPLTTGLDVTPVCVTLMLKQIRFCLCPLEFEFKITCLRFYAQAGKQFDRNLTAA